MSLQTGRRLAITKHAVIDPRNLKILAFELDGPHLDQVPSFLGVNDIREIGNMGIIIDSSDEFVGLDDVIKIKEVYNFGFKLDNLAVKNQKGKKLGKVIGYSVEPSSFVVKQLSVRRPLLKSLTDTELLIDRSQIVEISNDAVVIKDETEKVRSHVKATAGSYTNPFRQVAAQPQPEAIKRD
jgi:uncharacterized protein YrrD